MRKAAGAKIEQQIKHVGMLRVVFYIFFGKERSFRSLPSPCFGGAGLVGAVSHLIIVAGRHIGGRSLTSAVYMDSSSLANNFFDQNSDASVYLAFQGRRYLLAHYVFAHSGSSKGQWALWASQRCRFSRSRFLNLIYGLCLQDVQAAIFSWPRR